MINSDFIFHKKLLLYNQLACISIYMDSSDIYDMNVDLHFSFNIPNPKTNWQALQDFIS